MTVLMVARGDTNEHRGYLILRARGCAGHLRGSYSLIGYEWYMVASYVQWLHEEQAPLEMEVSIHALCQAQGNYCIGVSAALFRRFKIGPLGQQRLPC